MIPMRILLVEDDAAGATWAKSALESLGHSVQVASTKGDALAAIRLGGFDAVIADLCLEPDITGMGGADVAEEAVRSGMASSLVTGYPSECYQRREPSLIAQGVVCRAKPFAIEELVTALCIRCESARAASCVHAGQPVSSGS